MSSTAIAILKAQTNKGTGKSKAVINSLLACVVVASILALGAYLYFSQKTASAEQAIKNGNKSIAQLEENNSILEREIMQSEQILQSEQELDKMELTRTSKISFIEKPSGTLVSAAK